MGTLGITVEIKCGMVPVGLLEDLPPGAESVELGRQLCLFPGGSSSEKDKTRISGWWAVRGLKSLPRVTLGKNTILSGLMRIKFSITPEEGKAKSPSMLVCGKEDEIKHSSRRKPSASQIPGYHPLSLSGRENLIWGEQIFWPSAPNPSPHVWFWENSYTNLHNLGRKRSISAFPYFFFLPGVRVLHMSWIVIGKFNIGKCGPL